MFKAGFQFGSFFFGTIAPHLLIFISCMFLSSSVGWESLYLFSVYSLLLCILCGFIMVAFFCLFYYDIINLHSIRIFQAKADEIAKLMNENEQLKEMIEHLKVYKIFSCCFVPASQLG